MRIIRPEQTWCVLLTSGAERLCLHGLALRHGYRIGELSTELRCTERYLHKVFIRDIGLPPKEWMRCERMVVAWRKLAGGKSPDEVAADLGFATRNSFRREFMTIYQVPPLEFQRGCFESGYG